MRKLVFATFATFALLQPATATFADTTNSATNDSVDTVKVWKIDFSGRPPFKRELIELPVADVAALEEENKIVETERSWQVKFVGKPPFKRRLLEIPVIDAASLEFESAEQSSVKKRPAGSIKRHR